MTFYIDKNVLSVTDVTRPAERLAAAKVAENRSAVTGSTKRMEDGGKAREVRVRAAMKSV